MTRHYHYDVVVAGGGTAGIAAAAGAAKAGAKTLLIERNPYLGGQATHSNVAAYCGFHARGNPPVQVVSGIGQLVLDKLKELGDPVKYQVSAATGNASIPFHPERLKLALDIIAAETGADLLLHTVLIGAEVSEGRITSIECADDAGRFTVTARAFVDATGDANLAFLAGSETSWGNEEGIVQQASLPVRVDGVPRDLAVTPAKMQEAVIAAKAAGIAPLPKEKGFFIRTEGEDFGFCTLPSVTVDSMDAAALTEAEQSLRQQAHAYIKAFRLYMPGMENCSLVSTGPQMGLRESRRITGLKSLSYKDVLSAAKVPDSIARGGWSPEIHVTNNVEYIYIDDCAWFNIPIGAIKARTITNLWSAGRNISCDSIAHASIRVMGTGFATGHGAGVAAALTLDRPEYHYDAIKTELLKQNALL